MFILESGSELSASVESWTVLWSQEMAVVERPDDPSCEIAVNRVWPSRSRFLRRGSESSGFLDFGDDSQSELTSRNPRLPRRSVSTCYGMADRPQRTRTRSVPEG